MLACVCANLTKSKAGFSNVGRKRKIIMRSATCMHTYVYRSINESINESIYLSSIHLSFYIMGWIIRYSYIERYIIYSPIHPIIHLSIMLIYYMVSVSVSTATSLGRHRRSVKQCAVGSGKEVAGGTENIAVRCFLYMYMFREKGPCII
jgi:hypothetical protein